MELQNINNVTALAESRCVEVEVMRRQEKLNEEPFVDCYQIEQSISYDCIE